MFVKLDNPVLFTKAIELISDLVIEVRIKISEFGLSITAMDPANVAMIGFKLPKSAFSKFEAGNEVLGINLENLKRVLRRCKATSSLIIEKKDNFLDIQIEDRIKRKFSVSLIEVESEDIDFDAKVGRMEFVSKVDMASIDLIDAVDDCLVVADACSFIVDEGKFIIEARNLNSAKAEFSGDEAKINGENCKSRYSLEYLQKFSKGSKLAERTHLEFSNEHPLKMIIKKEGMEISFILAPRVETD